MSERIRTVGVLGLGQIGGGVARALARAGREVVAYDVRPEAMDALAGSIAPASSPAEVSSRSDAVLLAVFDDEQVRAVLTGAESILAPDDRARVAGVMSTVSLDTIRWAHAHAAEHGVALVDCAVTGGQHLKEEGRIVVFAGGEPEALEALRPVLEVFAEPLLHMGPTGAGIQAKLARNVIHYGTWHAAWEGARLAAACGLDVDKLVQAVRVSDQWTGATMGLVADYGIGPDPVDPGDERMMQMAQYLSNVAHKDLRAALELAAEHGVRLPGAELGDRLYDAVVGLGELDEDFETSPAVVAGGIW